MTSTKQKVIEATCQLIERQGHAATGLNQIVDESGAPKGSLYYHFPEGKDEIVEEAILLAGQRTADRIRQALDGQPDLPEAVHRFVEDIAHHVELTDYTTGGPLTAVAMETATGNPRLNQACRTAFHELQSAFQEALIQADLTESRSEELATFITSAIEGGVILSRTYHSGDPLRKVGQQLAELLAGELGSS